MKKSPLSSITPLAAGLALLAGLLAATPGVLQAQGEAIGEFAPIEEGEVPALGLHEGDFTLRRVPQTPEARSLLPPVSPEVYARMKEGAVFDPRAEIVVPSGPAESGFTAEANPLVAGSWSAMDLLSSTNNAIPPDVNVTKSPNRFLQAVNRAVQLRNDSGASFGLADLNVFFGASTSDGLLFDPKVYFDNLGTNKRMYVVALQKSGTSLSKIWLAVSRSQDPSDLNSSSWCRYQINSARNLGTSDASWADYPGLGGGADALVISANQFRFSNSTFTYSVVYAIPKNGLSNNASSCPSLSWSVFQPATTAGDSSIFTLQPVDHYSAPSSFTGTTNPAYLVSTRFGTSSTYRLWRLRNVATSPSLQLFDVTGFTFTYGLQPNALQHGSTPSLDTGDDRVTQAAGLGNLIWAAHGTVCNVGGGANESCVRTVSITVSQVSGGPSGTAGREINTGDSDGNHFFWPGIAVNSVGQNVIAFLGAGTSRYLSGFWAFRDTNESSFTTLATILTGSCVQSSTRSGDYVGVSTDLTDDAIFVTAEAVRNLSGSCRWATQIMRIIDF